MAELVILHTADLHGRLSAAAAARLRRMKTDLGALLLDSGDALPVPNVLAVPWRAAVARRMADAGYDAMVLGNREYFFRANGIYWAARSFSFPIVATNLALSPSARVEHVVWVSHPTGEVAVLGLARCMIRPGSSLQRLSNVRWRDPVEAVRDVIESVRRRSVWVVALSHLGMQDDLRLARECPELDVVLGAHDHLLTAVAAGPVGPFVIHSGCYGRAASVITLRRSEVCQPCAFLGGRPNPVDVTVEVVWL